MDPTAQIGIVPHPLALLGREACPVTLAQRRDLNFDYARALFQIAIVLGSVSIVAASRPLLWLCALLAVAATLLAANGFFLVIELHGV